MKQQLSQIRVMPDNVQLAISAMITIGMAGRIISADDIAQQHGTAARHFEATLRKLARFGLIESKRGPKGGYTLGCLPTHINMWSILSAVSVRAEHPDFPRGHEAQMKRLMASINGYMSDRLQQLTLAHLIADIRKKAA